MRDPREDDELDEDREGPDGEQAASGRPPLSDEVARRWDPGRLVKMMGRKGGAGQPLDATTRARFERKLGVDLGGVRIYQGEVAEKVTKQHSAEAVTVGGTGMIFMGGKADRSPATAAGQALLAHELTHVAQSSRGIYRSAPGQPAPLATESNEREAEAVEASVEAEASGPPRPAAGAINPEKAREELVAVITGRVVELLYEEDRIHILRNGDDPWRP